MNLDREAQCLLLDGRTYAPHDVKRLVAGGCAHCSEAERDLFLFLSAWWDDAPVLTVRTSGSTGTPRPLAVSKERMMRSACLTCEALSLRPGDTALLCMNLRYIGAMMMVVRALVCGLNLVVREASGHPLSGLDVPVRFAAMVPLQVHNSLAVPHECDRLKRVDILIIGGGAIDERLERRVRDLPGAVYSTYGMTETLSHIALRRLNGPSASDRYRPFASVRLSLCPDDDALVIDAPLLCDDVLHTRDIARIFPDGSFLVVGRKDNVINSGGLKIQAETLEKMLQPLIELPFVITSVPDERLGEAVTLLVETAGVLPVSPDRLAALLPAYHLPRHLFAVREIPRTENGKTDRPACRRLAEALRGEG